MAQDQILITNLTAGRLALSLKFGERQQLQRVIPLGGSIDVSTVATLDQLNKDPTLQRLLNATPPAISITVIPGTDVPGFVTDQEVRQRPGYPIIDQLVAGGAGLSTGTPAAFSLKGRNFLSGQVQASLAYGAGTSALTFTANRPGTPGNLIRIVLVDAASLSVATSGGALAGESLVARTITVNFRGATHSNTDTASAIATAVNSDATAQKLVHVAAGGGGNVVASSGLQLSGGVGAGFKVYVGAIEQDVVNTITSSTVPGKSVVLTGYAAGDLANLSLYVNATYSFSMAVSIAA